MNLIDEDKTKIIEWAKKHPEFKNVYLYGSMASDNTEKVDDKSDIDLAIEFNVLEQDTTRGTWIIWRNKFNKNPDIVLSREIHLKVYDKDFEDEIVETAVKNEGILIYSINQNS